MIITPLCILCYDVNKAESLVVTGVFHVCAMLGNTKANLFPKACGYATAFGILDITKVP